MRNLWLKIGFGAAGIFVVGMMGVTLVKSAKAAAVNAFNDAVDRVPAAVAAAQAARADRAAAGTERLASLTDLEQAGAGDDRFVDIPFRLEGADLGMLTSGSIRRTRSNALPSMELLVELSDADARAQLDDCILIPERKHHDSDFSGGFRCATTSDHDLVTFGKVRFTPGDFTRALMLTEAQASEMRRGEPFEARADLHGRVNVEATGNQGELVKVQADNRGAHIRIHDEKGRDIFQLLADSLGASLRVRDKNGRDIVRFAAGGGQLSLSIDTTAH